MSAVNVNIDLSTLRSSFSAITREILPRVREAVGGIAAQGQKDWANAVMKAPGIWAEEKKQYASSIKWEYTGDFSARIWTEYKLADQIEQGRPARDLKLMLNTSLKVRVAQQGKHAGQRYLVVPLQHNTPGNSAHAQAMPSAIYEAALQLAPSRVTGIGKRESGTGAWSPKTRSPLMVPQRQYEWGGRIEGNMMNGFTRDQTRRYDGMVRFETSGKGKSKHSTFLTFRVMGEWSSGWVVPAQPGRQFVTQVVGRLQPIAEQVIGKAVQLDLSGG